jgi:DNA polymerase-3 subunit epsilon
MKHSDTVLFIDTETGGLDPKKYSLLSVGLVIWGEGEIHDKKEIFINDGKLHATKEALVINKINLDEHRINSISPNEAIQQILQFIECNFDTSEKITLAGHNICFDIRFIRQLFESQEYSFGEIFSHRSIDTSSILYYLYLAGKLESKIVGSDAAFSHFGIEVSGRHTALGDAVATAQLFSMLIKLWNIDR